MTKVVKILSRADILRSSDVSRVEVPVSEWGGSVYVKTLTAGQRDMFEAMLYKRMQAPVALEDEGKAKSTDKLLHLNRASLVIAACVDANGTPLFTDADLDALAGKSCSAVDKVVSAAQTLNKLTDAAIAETVKN